MNKLGAVCRSPNSISWATVRPCTLYAATRRKNFGSANCMRRRLCMYVCDVVSYSFDGCFSSYFAAVSLVRVFNKSKNRVYAVTFAPAHTRFTRALKKFIHLVYGLVEIYSATTRDSTDTIARARS